MDCSGEVELGLEASRDSGASGEHVATAGVKTDAAAFVQLLYNPIRTFGGAF